MKVKGLSLAHLKRAARRAGRFKLENVRTEGNYVFFVLRMRNPTPAPKNRTKRNPDMRYRKQCSGRLIWGKGPAYKDAVCFHGFKEFFFACFDFNPWAVVRTRNAAYLGLEDFRQKFSAVGEINVGNMMCPMAFREACLCEE